MNKAYLVYLFFCTFLSSCTNLKTVSSTQFPVASTPKGYAIIVDNSVSSAEVEEILKEQLKFKNYFFDNESPDVLFLISRLPKETKVPIGHGLSKNTGLIKLRKDTFFLQAIETQTYKVVWQNLIWNKNELHFNALRSAFSD